MDEEAAGLARIARAFENLRCISAIADKSDDTPAGAEQDCNHFSLRGYVATLQRKDPNLCSPIFRNYPQYDEHDDSYPDLASKHRRWDCPKCLNIVKVSGHRPKSENNSVELNGMKTSGCSIPHMTPPCNKMVDPPYPLGQTTFPPAEIKTEDGASLFALPPDEIKTDIKNEDGASLCALPPDGFKTEIQDRGWC